MTNKELFKEAIADAKQVREAALANAKAALEETLTPRLHSMLAAKLQEMDGDDAQDDDLEEDFDLSEILAELEDEKLDEKKDDEAEEDADEAEEDADEAEEDADEAEDVADMSVEDLKDLIKSIVDEEINGDPANDEAPVDMEMGGDEPAMDMSGDNASNDDEIDLEELLAELDAMGEDNLDEADNSFIAKLSSLPAETLAKLKKFYDTELSPAGVKSGAIKSTTLPSNVSEELNEAIKTINTLRKEINEINVFNAKLLYMNKIFSSKNLTSEQKLRVISSFDKATNVKEAKMVFESLSNVIQKAQPTGKAIKESMGFASKATGMAPKKTIVESNSVITRFQKLANIK